MKNGLETDVSGHHFSGVGPFANCGPGNQDGALRISRSLTTFLTDTDDIGHFLLSVPGGVDPVRIVGRRYRLHHGHSGHYRQVIENHSMSS